MDSKHPPSPDSPVDRHRPSKEQQTVSKRQGHNGRLGWILFGTIAVASLLAIGILPRLSRQTELQAAVKAKSALPAVNVIHPHNAPAETNLVLPGSVVSLNQTTVYARSSGYLRRWLVDIGDRVQAGQLLAEIESPDVDQQAAQAQADLAQTQANLVQSRANLAKGQSDLQQAHANLVLARKTWERWQALVQQGVVSQQDADTRQATYNVNLANVQSAENTINSNRANVNAAQASVNSSQANLRRYTVLQSFEKVTAPFSGIVTARNVDVGALITSGGSNNTSLYTITSYDTLDVNVNVPQSLASSIQLGQTAQIQIRELPQQAFIGRVIRTTNALDPSSRTLLTQVAVPNSAGIMRPGMYATVKFSVTRTQPALLIPDSALVINARGTQVAIVTQNQTVHFQKIVLGRDNGTEVEVTSGLNGNESLIANPTTDLIENTRVRVAAASRSAPK